MWTFPRIKSIWVKPVHKLLLQNFIKSVQYFVRESKKLPSIYSTFHLIFELGLQDIGIFQCSSFCQPISYTLFLFDTYLWEKRLMKTFTIHLDSNLIQLMTRHNKEFDANFLHFTTKKWIIANYPVECL